jgi:hypothetical protein
LNDLLAEADHVEPSPVLSIADYKCFLISSKCFCLLRMTATEIRQLCKDRPRGGTDPLYSDLTILVKAIERQSPQAIDHAE